MINRLKNKIIAKTGEETFSEILSGSSITFLIRVAGFAIGYVLTILISRAYGATILGAFTLSSTVLLMFSIAGRLGMDTSVVKYFAQNIAAGRWDIVHGIYRKMIAYILIAGVVLNLIFYYSSPYLAVYIFKKPYLTDYFRIISFAILPMILRFVNAESFRGFKMMKQYAFGLNVSYFLYALIFLSIATLFFKNDLMPNITYALGLLIPAVTSTFIIYGIIKKQSSAYNSSVTLKEIIWHSFPMMLSSSMILLSGWINTIVLGMYRSEADVGLYSVVFKIASFSSFILMSVNSIAGPKFAEYHAKNDSVKLAETAAHSASINFWASLPLFVLIFFLRDFILEIFGPEFEAGSGVLLFALAGQVFNNFCGAVGTFLNMTGGHRAFQNIVLISTIVNIVACFMLIPKYGIWGSAVAGMIYMILWNILSAVYIQKKTGIKTYYWPFPMKK